jgi:hypothetical protein
VSEPLKKPNPGEPWRPSAKRERAFIEAVEFVRQLQRSGGATPGRNLWQTGGIISVRNSSGADRDRYDVVGLGDPVFPAGANPSPEDVAAFQSRILLDGVTPIESSHNARFAILLEPVAQGKIGKACVAGVTVVRVDFDLGESAVAGYGYADIKHGDATCLRCDPSGSVRILWPPVLRYGWAGTVRWAVVRLGEPFGQLVGVELKVDHPGKGVVFDVYTGYWHPDTHLWAYEHTVSFKAIDWRDLTAYPEAGATGLGQWRRSTTYGNILEIVDLDPAAGT